MERSRVTVGEWLTAWLDKAIEPPARRQTSYDCYRRVIEKHLTPAIGDIRLQALRCC